MLFLLLLSKPLHGAWSAVRAARLAARTPLPAKQVFRETFEVFPASLCLLHKRHPANPFVTCQWREALPESCHFFIAVNNRFHIFR